MAMTCVPGPLCAVRREQQRGQQASSRPAVQQATAVRATSPAPPSPARCSAPLRTRCTGPPLATPAVRIDRTTTPLHRRQRYIHVQGTLIMSRLRLPSRNVFFNA